MHITESYWEMIVWP